MSRVPWSPVGTICRMLLCFIAGWVFPVPCPLPTSRVERCRECVRGVPGVCGVRWVPGWSSVSRDVVECSLVSEEAFLEYVSGGEYVSVGI